MRYEFGKFSVSLLQVEMEKKYFCEGGPKGRIPFIVDQKIVHYF